MASLKKHMKKDVGNKKLIVVLGMHRSGTSAITRGLQVMGVELGDKLLPPQKDNVTGFWEDVDINALNMEMLESLGTKWDAITPLKDSEINLLGERGYLSRAIKLLGEKTSNTDVFGFKDPRTAKLLPFWKEAFAAAKLKAGYLIAIRNPLSVYKSLEKRRGLDIEHSSLLWLDHTINSLVRTMGEERVLIDYDRLMNAPEAELERIAEGLRLKIIPQELMKFRTEFLNNELQHTTYQLDDLLQNEMIHPLVKETYSVLLDVMENKIPLNDKNLEKQITQWGNESLRLRPLLAFTERLETQYKILLREKNADIQQRDADIQFLLGLFRNSETATLALLDSNRWKIGNKIAEIWLRLRGRQPEPIVTEYLLDVFKRLHQWELKRNAIANQLEKKFSHISAEIVICVYNALNDVKACLDSIQLNTDARHGLILVDDGSNDECRAYLADYASHHQNVILIRNEQPRGYTVAANQGLRQSKAEYVALLNSDTIVTPNWLENLLECAESSQRIGMVGPLSNAASWQSVPRLFNVNKDWDLNPLPQGWNPVQMSKLVMAQSQKEFPRVPLLNGFCLVIKRNVIETVGYLDEQSFPEGYGEENDYCLRAVDAGFELAVADHVYIYHSKSKSYTHERRLALSKKSQSALAAKHSQKRIDNDVATVRKQPVLEKIRHRVDKSIANQMSRKSNELLTHKEKKSFGILFILPVSGWGGGIHSIVQEATSMRAMGANAKIAVWKNQLSQYRSNYPGIEKVDDTFVGFDSENELIELAAGFHVVVGTIYHSMDLVNKIATANPGVLPAYYVQDYEPWFFEKNTRQWKQAYRSYTLVKDAVLFAKTNWLCNIVSKEHNIPVEKVEPSLDHSVYYPDFTVNKQAKWPVRISAMIRPSSPRRGAQRTMRVLNKIKQKYGQRVEVDLFGCKDQDFVAYQLEDGFDYSNHGELTREHVANLLRTSDIFVDFSDYQAFGRTAIEAMACGCVVIVPQEGGVHDFAVDHENCLIVNSKNEEDCFTTVNILIEQPELRMDLRQNALEKSEEFSPSRAARSELDLLTSKYSEFLLSQGKKNKISRLQVNTTDELRVTGILSRTAKGFVGSAYIRLIQPLTHPSLKRKLTFVPGTASDVYTDPPDMVVVQRIAISDENEACQLVNFCSSNEIKLIYEVDDDLFEIGSSGSSHPEAEKYAKWIQGAKVLALNADLVTVSSENLKSKLLGLNPHISVLPNALDEQIWQINSINYPANKTSNDHIGILYMGTRTHNQDLEMIMDALVRIKENYRDKVRFDIVGVSSEKLNSKLFNVIDVPSDTSEYPEFVRWMLKRAPTWSIGLAPLVQTSFNECKSYIKFLDYSAVGLASVCSLVTPYESVITNEVDGILAENSTDCWYDALALLIENASLRETIRLNAYRNIQTNHTLRRKAMDWWGLYSSLE